MSKAHGQRPWGSVLRSWPISTVTESRPAHTLPIPLLRVHLGQRCLVGTPRKLSIFMQRGQRDAVIGPTVCRRTTLVSGLPPLRAE
jgi:hypothetical protein